jgi:hypothetical protein
MATKQKLVIDFQIMLIGDIFPHLVKRKVGEVMIPRPGKLRDDRWILRFANMSLEVWKLERASKNEDPDARTAQKTLRDALSNEWVEIIEKSEGSVSTEDDPEDSESIDQEFLVRVTKRLSDLHQRAEQTHNTTVPDDVVILSDDRKVHEKAQQRGIRTIRSDEIRLELPARSPSEGSAIAVS